MNHKKWSICFGIITVTMLMLVGGMTAAVDPFFHYHAPLDVLNYRLDNQRYQNDGILRHFQYDAIITGTSQTENFKTSEFDALFETEAVKVPFSGATLKEINGRLSGALKNNYSTRYVLQSIDPIYILIDEVSYSESMYPWYLYDDTILNDAPYLLNKDVFFSNTIITLRYTMRGYETTSFDEYSNWMGDYQFGKEAVDLTYSRPEKQAELQKLTDDERKTIHDNLMQNVVSLVEEYPNVEFYLFFPPYSIYWWDEIQRNGKLGWQIDIFREASEILVEYSNVHLFSFFSDYDLICNLDYYKDRIHYHEDINSRMLDCMAKDEFRLTKENYQTHWDEIERFFNSYPFDSWFE